MNDTSSNHHDLLERSVQALRAVRIPEGPPPALVGRTLGLLQAAAPPTPWIARFIPVSAMSKIAAAILIAAGAIIGYVISINSQSVAYADIAKRIGEARTLRFRADMHLAERSQPVSFRALFKEPAQMRLEQDGGKVAVFDLSARKAIAVNHAERHAFVIDFSRINPAHAAAMKMIDEFRSLAERQGEPLGVQTIAGRQAQGFRVRQKNQEIHVWAETKTGNLLRVELPLQGLASNLVLSDFAFDVPMDPALFDLTPPAGYALQPMDIQRGRGTLDREVAALLAEYARRSDGNFPPRLDDWHAYMRLVAASTKSGQLSADELDLMQTVGRVYASLFMRSRSDWAYLGANLKVGNGDKIIFWYRPRGSNLYRAVYDDLHVAELAADQLPRPAIPN